jgi:hypothetical protein
MVAFLVTVVMEAQQLVLQMLVLAVEAVEVS